MSPEQIQGGEVGPPSDVFSFGTVIHYAATGDGPWGTGATEAMLYRLVHEPPNLERLPATIHPIVLRCLAKEPAGRPTPAEILAELGDPDLLGDGHTVRPMVTWDGAQFASLAPDLPARMPDSMSEQNTMSVPGDPNRLPRPETAPAQGAGPVLGAVPAQRPAPMQGPAPAMPTAPRPRAAPAGSLSAEDALRITLVSLIAAAILAAGVIVWFINEWFAIAVYALTTIAAAVWWLRS